MNYALDMELKRWLTSRKHIELLAFTIIKQRTRFQRFQINAIRVTDVCLDYRVADHFQRDFERNKGFEGDGCGSGQHGQEGKGKEELHDG